MLLAYAAPIPSRKLPKPATAVARAGRSYEKRIFNSLLISFPDSSLTLNPWFVYQQKDSAENSYCVPDIILVTEKTTFFPIKIPVTEKTPQIPVTENLPAEKNSSFLVTEKNNPFLTAEKTPPFLTTEKANAEKCIISVGGVDSAENSTAEKIAIVIEAKLTYKQSAYEKLINLYCPVVSLALSLPTFPLVIVKNLTSFSPPAKFTISESLTSFFPLLQWLSNGKLT